MSFFETRPAGGDDVQLLLFVDHWSVLGAAAEVRARELASELNGELEVIDITEQPGRAAEFRIMAVPTLLLSQGGQVKRRIVGDLSQLPYSQGRPE